MNENRIKSIKKRNKLTEDQFSLYLVKLNDNDIKPGASEAYNNISCPKCRSTLRKELERKSFTKEEIGRMYHHIDGYCDSVRIETEEYVTYICKMCNQKYFKMNYSSYQHRLL